MGLSNIFNKNKTISKPSIVWPMTLAASAKGIIVPMKEIPDAVFSEGILGHCCGIEPEEGAVYAPIDGKIVQLADSLHAIGIEGTGDIEILIHVGIDTVDMNGDGFCNHVKPGDTIQKGQLLLTMDLNKIKEAEHPAVVITIVTNSDDFSSIETIATGAIKPQEDMMKIAK